MLAGAGRGRVVTPRRYPREPLPAVRMYVCGPGGCEVVVHVPETNQARLRLTASCRADDDVETFPCLRCEPCLRELAELRELVARPPAPTADAVLERERLREDLAEVLEARPPQLAPILQGPTGGAGRRARAAAPGPETLPLFDQVEDRDDAGASERERL